MVSDDSHPNSSPILDFKSLLSRVESPRDKVLVALVGALLTDEAALETANALSEYEPIDYNKIMHGVRVRNILGIDPETVKRQYNLSDSQLQEIYDYAGVENSEVN